MSEGARSRFRDSLETVKIEDGRIDDAMLYAIIKARLIGGPEVETSWCTLGFRHAAGSNQYYLGSTSYILTALFDTDRINMPDFNHDACHDHRTWCIKESMISICDRIEAVAKSVDEFYHTIPNNQSSFRGGWDLRAYGWQADIVANALLEEALKTLWCILNPTENVKDGIGHNYKLAFSDLSHHHASIVSLVSRMPFFNQMFLPLSKAQKLVDTTFADMHDQEWMQSRYWWVSDTDEDREQTPHRKFMVAVALFVRAKEICIEKGIATPQPPLPSFIGYLEESYRLRREGKAYPQFPLRGVAVAAYEIHQAIKNDNQR